MSDGSNTPRLGRCIEDCMSDIGHSANLEVMLTQANNRISELEAAEEAELSAMAEIRHIVEEKPGTLSLAYLVAKIREDYQLMQAHKDFVKSVAKIAEKWGL